MDQIKPTSSSTSDETVPPHDNTLGESGVGVQPASAASLLGLPVELQKTILEYLTTNVDKKNVCLTCKKLQALATPLLYKHMEIFAGRLNHDLLSTLEEGHPGLSHVRTIRVMSEPSKPSDKLYYTQTSPEQVVCRLINTIPRNSLTKFEVPDLDLSCAGIHFALRLRQAKVCNYQHNTALSGVFFDCNLDWDMIAPASDELAHITNLQIYVGVVDYDHMDRAGSIIAHTSALQGLDLEFREMGIYEDEEYCDGAVRIMEDMFYARTKPGQAMRLKSLRITSMCLLLVSEVLTTVLELKDLKHLQLVRCKDIDPFLRRLEPLGLNLSSLCIEDLDQEDWTDYAIADFIRSLGPLKRLTLSFNNMEGFDQDALLSHKSSLESLRIEDDPMEEQPIEHAFRYAPNLEQLALSGFYLEDGWLPDDQDPFCDTPDLLDTLKTLESLRVLKLTVHFSSLNISANPTQMLCMPPVLRTVRKVAEQIFALELPKLTAVVFVVSGQRDHLLTHNRFAFLLSKRLDQDGVMRFSVIPMEPHMVKHHVPCADILGEDKFVFA